MHSLAKKDFENLVKALGNVMDAFSAAFFLYDGGTNSLNLLASFSLSGHLNLDANVKVGEGMIGWVAKEQKRLSVKEFKHDTTTLKLYTEEEDIKSFMAAPVTEGDNLIGVLTVDSKRKYVFTPKDIKILDDFAIVFSDTAVRHERKRKFKKDAANIQALDEIVSGLSSCKRMADIVEKLYENIGRLVEHSRFLFALKSSEEGTFNLISEPSRKESEIKRVPLKLDESLMGWVIKNNRALNHPDLSGRADKHGLGDAARSRIREGFRSFVGVPMVVRKHVIGALGILGREKNAFAQRDVRLLSILGAIAASHVAGSYAYGVSMAAKKTDTLTGLGNYIYMQEKISKLDGSLPGALLTIDVCNFSSITSEFSVKTADLVLVELARFFKRILKNEGFVARYYGDVFLIYLNDYDRDEVQIASKKLLDIIRAKTFFINDKPITFECRGGLAFYPDDSRSGDELIKRSFEALKEAQSRQGGKTISPVGIYSDVRKAAGK
ncbi:MAG: sensor domain-containing diguanylate cyclase [Nitrospinota bacterium]